MKANGVAGAVLALAVAAAAGEDLEQQTVDDLYGPERTGGAAAPPSSSLLRPLGVTLLIVGAAGGLFVLLRKAGARRPLFGSGGIAILERAYISPKHSIALVRVRNRVLLLGVGQDVRTLAAFDKPEEVLGFDGAFSRELTDALAGAAPAAESAAPAPEASGVALEPYRKQIRRLRAAVGKLRTRISGEARP